MAEPAGGGEREAGGGLAEVALGPVVVAVVVHHVVVERSELVSGSHMAAAFPAPPAFAQLYADDAPLYPPLPPPPPVGEYTLFGQLYTVRTPSLGVVHQASDAR